MEIAGETRTWRRVTGTGSPTRGASGALAGPASALPVTPGRKVSGRIIPSSRHSNCEERLVIPPSALSQTTNQTHKEPQTWRRQRAEEDEEARRIEAVDMVRPRRRRILLRRRNVQQNRRDTGALAVQDHARRACFPWPAPAPIHILGHCAVGERRVRLARRPPHLQDIALRLAHVRVGRLEAVGGVGGPDVGQRGEQRAFERGGPGRGPEEVNQGASELGVEGAERGEVAGGDGTHDAGGRGGALDHVIDGLGPERAAPGQAQAVEERGCERARGLVKVRELHEARKDPDPLAAVLGCDRRHSAARDHIRRREQVPCEEDTAHFAVAPPVVLAHVDLHDAVREPALVQQHAALVSRRRERARAQLLQARRHLPDKHVHQRRTVVSVIRTQCCPDRPSDCQHVSRRPSVKNFFALLFVETSTRRITLQSCSSTPACPPRSSSRKPRSSTPRSRTLGSSAVTHTRTTLKLSSAPARIVTSCIPSSSPSTSTSSSWTCRSAASLSPASTRSERGHCAPSALSTSSASFDIVTSLRSTMCTQCSRPSPLLVQHAPAPSASRFAACSCALDTFSSSRHRFPATDTRPWSSTRAGNARCACAASSFTAASSVSHRLCPCRPCSSNRTARRLIAERGGWIAERGGWIAEWPATVHAQRADA
eukprot:2769234-Rhodomonas_salina.2